MNEPREVNAVNCSNCQKTIVPEKANISTTVQCESCGQYPAVYDKKTKGHVIHTGKRSRICGPVNKLIFCDECLLGDE